MWKLVDTLSEFEDRVQREPNEESKRTYCQCSYQEPLDKEEGVHLSLRFLFGHLNGTMLIVSDVPVAAPSYVVSNASGEGNCGSRGHNLIMRAPDPDALDGHEQIL